MKRFAVLLALVFAFRSAEAALPQPVEADAKGLAKELAATTKSYLAATQEIERLRETLKEYLHAEGRVQAIAALVSEMELETFRKRSLYEQYEETSANDSPITADTFIFHDTDPETIRLQQQLGAAEQRLRVVEVQGKDRREYKEARATYDSLAKLMLAEHSRKLLKYQEEHAEQAKQDFLDSQQRLLRMKDRLESVKKTVKVPDAMAKQYQDAVDKAERLKKKIEELVARIEKL